MSPVSVKKVSRKERVGVDTVRLPTLTTPPDPTRKPWGLAKKTLPPILLPLIELSMPLIVTRESVTMLIRLALPPGRCMLTTCPPPTAKVENELKALDPLVVEVCTLVAPPLALTVVWVRPSGWMLLGPAVAGGPSTKPALSASSAVILLRPVPDLPRPLAISATAVQIMRASFQTRRYRRLTDEWRCMTGSFTCTGVPLLTFGDKAHAFVARRIHTLVLRHKRSIPQKDEHLTKWLVTPLTFRYVTAVEALGGRVRRSDCRRHGIICSGLTCGDNQTGTLFRWPDGWAGLKEGCP